ncbi:AraC family transcriptional regulator [Halioxenophilus sp. WMMB6]|uniref:helix-turn-helix domain-containing protein n=1 Tax=Halioxenophilus sp. WMMB6 TaxID=3073815 RepID=UPI00295EA41F|nr:AraC family transcriptional regulator [Halioxenophilus sp. WMMB6]
MEQTTEKCIVLPNVTVELATINWEGVEDTPGYEGYVLSQRLSDNHAPLRIGNVTIPEVMPRVRSVGLLPPGHPLRLFPVESPLKVIYCFFDIDFFESTTGVSHEIWEAHTAALVLMRNQRLEVLMQEIHSELEQPGFGSELLIESVTNIMLVELARYIRELQFKDEKKRDGMALAPWQLRRIQERIQASAELGYPGLAELAELCNISQGHLARSFKASTGWQIHKYIAEERLNDAKRLLAQAPLSCEEIAVQLGFKSAAYFSTAFRRMTGKSPTEFRRSLETGGAGDSAG